MDVLTRKTKRSKAGAGSDDDSDDGPPPDPDEPQQAPAPKKEKRPTGEAREVQVSVRKAVDDKGVPTGGGITSVRREMLLALRAEEDEQWVDYTFYDGEVSLHVFFLTHYEPHPFLSARPQNPTMHLRTSSGTRRKYSNAGQI